MPDSNVLTSKRSRGENIIKHPQESYVEVSTRSITKIRSCASKAKKKTGPVLCTVALSLWTACLGAIIGYLPNIYEMIRSKSLEQLSGTYISAFIACILFFIIWRVLCSKEDYSLNRMIEIIEDELSEDRVPINRASALANGIPPNMMNPEGNNSIFSDAEIIAGGKQ